MCYLTFQNIPTINVCDTYLYSVPITLNVLHKVASLRTSGKPLVAENVIKFYSAEINPL